MPRCRREIHCYYSAALPDNVFDPGERQPKPVPKKRPKQTKVRGLRGDDDHSSHSMGPSLHSAHREDQQCIIGLPRYEEAAVRLTPELRCDLVLF